MSSRNFPLMLFILIATTVFVLLVVSYASKLFYTPQLLAPAPKPFTLDAAPSINTSIHHNKWIVVASRRESSDTVKFLCGLQGWNVVVVGDHLSSDDLRETNCVYLSSSEIRRVNRFSQDSITATINEDYRKLQIGYLHAITNGATAIYVAEDIDGIVVDPTEVFWFEGNKSALVYASNTLIFDPYRHFRQPAFWMKDNPSEQKKSDREDYYKLFESWAPPLIQQGLMNVNVDSTIDSGALDNPKVELDPAAPPVIVPAGIFSSKVTFNQSLYMKDAFWALVRPTDSASKMAMDVYGLWIQRLLWEIGGNFGFFYLPGYQNKKCNAELKTRFDNLLQFVSNWTCPDILTFFQCIDKLSVNLAEMKFWSYTDVKFIQNWLQDLNNHGYQEPARVSRIYLDEIKSNGGKIKFSPARYFSSQNEIKPGNTFCYTKHIQLLTKVCPRLNLPAPTLKSKNSNFFDDILLIVVYNWPFFGNSNYLEAIYRPFFPNIIYCGVDRNVFETKTANILGYKVSFVEVPDIQRGYFAPWCMIKAIQMNYNVSGYLVVGDDVLVNVWRILDLDKNKIWRAFPIVLNSTSKNIRWPWWKRPVGAGPYNISLNFIKGVNKSKQYPNNLINDPSKFLSNLETNNGGPLMVAYRVSDMYYIPAYLRYDALYYLKLFTERHTFLELAVPTTLRGLSKDKNIISLPCKFLWTRRRANPFAFYNLKGIIFHPIKLSNKHIANILCEKFIPNLVSTMHGVDLHNVVKGAAVTQK